MASAEPKLIKVCLTNQGEDTETPWAHDLGPAPGAAAGARRVKLVNVPFMHAKPTWGDTIVVSPVADTFPTWDRGGVKWNEISSKIVDDGGRWAMILDYRLHDDVAANDAFSALARVCDVERIVCEGAWAPRDADPGRAYLAVPKDTNVNAVMDRLTTAGLPMHLILVHPELKQPRAGTVVGVSAATPRKPARPKTEKPIDEDLAPAPRPRATTDPAAKPAKGKTATPAKAVPAAKAASAAPAPSKPAPAARATKAVPAAPAAPAAPATKVVPAAKTAPAARAAPAPSKPAPAAKAAPSKAALAPAKTGAPAKAAPAATKKGAPANTAATAPAKAVFTAAKKGAPAKAAAASMKKAAPARAKKAAPAANRAAPAKKR